ncbi:hypothetical protein TL08_02410 [Actinoalloteichus hymeniacidonis]|uniref:Uncharacterized protein n=2 Tax=Actinoalloteichus hymeniacidonis TaxID=340345 RepID=A0AAC9MWI2_9PSEU|nr:hypothetical protein TL08_02410 [Actinoalloteichus hymeniacidonis]
MPQAQGMPRGGANRPPSVEAAFWLFLANSVLGLLSAILTFVSVDSLLATQPGYTEVLTEGGSAPADFIRGTLITAASIALVFQAIFLIFVFMMRNGRNWARILLTVLAVLGLVTSIGNLDSIGLQFEAGGIAAVIGIIAILGLLLPIGATITMYLPPSNNYFKYN